MLGDHHDGSSDSDDADIGYTESGYTIKGGIMIFGGRPEFKHEDLVLDDTLFYAEDHECDLDNLISWIRRSLFLVDNKTRHGPGTGRVYCALLSHWEFYSEAELRRAFFKRSRGAWIRGEWMTFAELLDEVTFTLKPIGFTIDDGPRAHNVPPDEGTMTIPRGYSTYPTSPRSLDVMLRYIRESWCACDDERYEWLLDWLARAWVEMRTQGTVVYLHHHPKDYMTTHLCIAMSDTWKCFNSQWYINGTRMNAVKVAPLSVLVGSGTCAAKRLAERSPELDALTAPRITLCCLGREPVALTMDNPVNVLIATSVRPPRKRLDPRVRVFNCEPITVGDTSASNEMNAAWDKGTAFVVFLRARYAEILAREGGSGAPIITTAPEGA